LSAVTGNPIRDVATAIKNMIQGKGAIVQHSHRALDGGLISTDGTITITNALQRPLKVDSEVLIEHLNPELWSGHHFYIGKTKPTIKLKYSLAIGDLWLNTTTYNSYVLNFYDGHQWVAVGSQGSVAWSNITGKPSTFPSTPHPLLDANVDSDTEAHTPVKGDTMYADASNLWQGFAIGTLGQYYRVLAGIPNWDSKIQTEYGAALPGAGNAGRLFQRTSDNTLWFDTGVSWVQA
jgi:hypothetical protein